MLRRRTNLIELLVRSDGAPIDLTFIPMLPEGARFTTAQVDQQRVSPVAHHGEKASAAVLVRLDGAPHTVSIAYQAAR